MRVQEKTNPNLDAVPSVLRATREAEARQQHVYDLRAGGNSSDGFYATLPAFADQTLSVVENRVSPLLDGYIEYVKTSVKERSRSRGEYAIEFLTLGMALKRYECAAQKTPRWIVKVARWLTWARERFATAKPIIDWVRAGVARYFLAVQVGQKVVRCGKPVERTGRLIDWMKSTGEFKQEARRIENWQGYLREINEEEATLCLQLAVELFEEFEREAEVALGQYTRGVAAFLAREHERMCRREDLLMCGKPAVEYHLNLVAAEVMNRGLRPDFVATRDRVVLVPGCMRGSHIETCGAHIAGDDITCAGCDPECAVNRITREMGLRGTRVYIVPHAGGFSRWLSRWQHTGAGVTAVACILNILPGGFEMRERGIASQCLPLDFPGCRKHWDRQGFPTKVNEPRLVQIASSSQSDSEAKGKS